MRVLNVNAHPDPRSWLDPDISAEKGLHEPQRAAVVTPTMSSPADFEAGWREQSDAPSLAGRDAASA